MGYDMRILGDPSPEETLAVEAANTQFREACNTRDALGRAGTTCWRREHVKQVKADHPEWVEVEHQGDILVGTPEWVAAQQAVNTAFDLMNRVEASYFRLNIGGMSRTRDIMRPLGMIHHECYDAAPPWTNDEGPDDESTLDRLKREPRLVWAPEVPGICDWKLGSNDGWLVTPVECLGALKKWEEACEDDPGLLVRVGGECGWWMEWLGYLAEAAQRGGFLVW